MNKILSCGNGGSYALGHGTRETVSIFKPIDSFVDIGVKIKKIA